MKLPRRQFLHLAAGAAALPAVIPHREGASLSVAAGAHRRSICRRRSDRHHRSSDRPMAVGASRPAICHREQARSRQQYWYGGGRECAAGRIHAPPGRCVNRDQCDALRETQFQLPPRHRTRLRHHLDPLHYGGKPIVPRADSFRVHRLCQGQSGQGQHGVGRQRNGRPSVGRTVQDDGRHQHGPRSVSRRGTCTD